MLARAFQDDPAWEWVLPSARRRAALLPWLFRANFEVTDGRGVDDRRRGARLRALGRPRAGPQMHVAPMLRALVATPLRLREATARFFAYGRAVEAMRGEARRPSPHWYLAGIGVDPAAAAAGSARPCCSPASSARPATGSRARCSRTTRATSPFYAATGSRSSARAHARGRPARLDDAPQAPSRLL